MATAPVACLLASPAGHAVPCTCGPAVCGLLALPRSCRVPPLPVPCLPAPAHGPLTTHAAARPRRRLQVRTQTLVKSAIIQVDAAPFKQWYQQHYGVEVGQKKKSGAAAAAAEGEAAAAQSSHVKRKLKQRNQGRKLDQLLDDQFATGRLYAAISSRPGQVRRQHALGATDCTSSALCQACARRGRQHVAGVAGKPAALASSLWLRQPNPGRVSELPNQLRRPTAACSQPCSTPSCPMFICT